MSDDPIRPLIDALDPLLVRAGFLAAQGGGDIALYCAAFVDIAEDFPYLPQAHDEQSESMEGACVDLTFTLTPTGLLKTIEFEAHTLEDTLADIGARDDAWLVLNAYDRPIAEVIATLHDVLSRLYGKRAVDLPITAGKGTAEVDDALAAALATRRRTQFDDSSSSVVFRVELP